MRSAVTHQVALFHRTAQKATNLEAQSLEGMTACAWIVLNGRECDLVAMRFVMALRLLLGCTFIRAGKGNQACEYKSGVRGVEAAYKYRSANPASVNFRFWS
jgi:hypothetical protein